LQKKSEKYSVCDTGGSLQTHIAALFLNHRINEDMPKSLKVKQEQRLRFCKLLNWTLD